MERFKPEINIFQEKETEKREIPPEKKMEAIARTEEIFFSHVKKTIGDILHFPELLSKEKIRESLRVMALATVFSIPVGERAFAERGDLEHGPEIYRELEQGFKELRPQMKQKQFLKEKYNVDVLGPIDKYMLEELKDIEEALKSVRNVAPNKVEELNLMFLKLPGGFYDGMSAVPNYYRSPSDLENYINQEKQAGRSNVDIITTELSFSANERNKKGTSYYDLIINKSSERIKPQEEDFSFNKIVFGRKDVVNSVYDKTENPNKGIIIHEISHLLHENEIKKAYALEKIFRKLNKQLPPLAMDGVTNRERPEGYVSFYPVMGRVYSEYLKYLKTMDKETVIEFYKNVYSDNDDKEFAVKVAEENAKFFKDSLENIVEIEIAKENSKSEIKEDIAETFTYMILRDNGEIQGYADDDPVVQEKIQAIRDFLAAR